MSSSTFVALLLLLQLIEAPNPHTVDEVCCLQNETKVEFLIFMHLSTFCGRQTLRELMFRTYLYQ